MSWKKHFRDWKLACALALIFALCSEAAPHLEPQFPEIMPTTASSLQITGGNNTNVSAGMYSWNSL